MAPWILGYAKVSDKRAITTMDSLLFILPIDNPASLYAMLFGFIFISAFGLPIPEEIVLLLAGYLSYLGFTDFFTTVIIMSASIVVADLAGYMIGRYTGDFIYDTILGHFEFTRALLQKGKKYMDRFGEKVVLITRPISGLRFVVPIMMGHFRMNAKRFVIYDIIAAIPYTLILISLSYYFGSVVTLIADVQFIKKIILWLIIGMVAIFLVKRYIKRRRARR